MPLPVVLLFTDVEDSTRLTEALGDEAASRLWSDHDRIVRRLLRTWGGREIDKSDGFLLLFSSVDDALACAAQMHRELGSLSPPLLSRAGVHRGEMLARENPPEDVASGAKPLELDGLAKAVTSRIMAMARGGQTLLSASAAAASTGGRWHLQSHGHWRMKGVAAPVEVFESGDEETAFLPPPDSPKSYRVVRTGEGWRASVEVHHTLPAERDEFIGRSDALTTLARRFDEGTRLVSVLGIGGIGKTRLALRYARDWLGDHPGGAWFCDLSAATTLDGIAHAAAQGLEMQLARNDPIQQVGAAISGRGQCLIVLDNFEQVAQHAEATLGYWLEHAPAARFVVTSRELLGIPGEATLPLEPLSQEESVRLFERRAVSAGGPHAVAASERFALPKLVDLLDRLPLAIELAAARTRVLGPQAMLERMGERFRLLASPRGRRDRQATLRATLAWSWDLLADAEQAALVQLSVFEGGFTMDSAEVVVDISEFDPAPWCVDLVQSLTDKSLVRKVDDARFDLLQSVKAFAAEVAPLVAVPRADSLWKEAARRHARHFGSLGELEATAHRCADIENLVLACRRSLEEGDRAAARRNLITAWFALRLTGPFQVAVDLADRLRSIAGADREALATALWVGGNARQLLGRMAEARELLESALRASESRSPMAARIACALGTIESGGGHPERAGALLEEALTAATALRDGPLQCRAMNSLGALADMQARPADARRWYESALTQARAMGDRRWQGAVLGNLGQWLHQQGHQAEALNCYLEALDHVTSSGDLRFEGNVRCNLGLLLHEQGRNTDALGQFACSLEVATKIGHLQLQAIVCCNLGLTHEALEEPVSAVARFREAVSVAETTGDRRVEAQATVYLGRSLARRAMLEEAHDCLARAAALLQDWPDPKYAALLACARAVAAAAAGQTESAQRYMRVALEAHGTPDAEVQRELERVAGEVSRC